MNYDVLLDTHVDMETTLKINGKIYHLAIEHDGKQHDQNDPEGALRAYLGMKKKTKQEILKFHIIGNNQIN